MAKVCCLLRISGKVQGVCYRVSARDFAVSLGLVGWVRNRKDGSVEALVQGNLEQVNSFKQWAEKGPGGAIVKDIKVTGQEQIPGLNGFVIRETA